MNHTAVQKSYRLCQISWCVIALALLAWLGLRLEGIRVENIIRFFPPCILRSFFGLYCPGCGGTRAVVELLGGHVLRSLWYHPVVVYSAALYGWYLLTNTIDWLCRGKTSIGSSYHAWYGTAAVIIVVVNCFLRNVMLLAFHITL